MTARVSLFSKVYLGFCGFCQHPLTCSLRALQTLQLYLKSTASSLWGRVQRYFGPTPAQECAARIFPSPPSPLPAATSVREAVAAPLPAPASASAAVAAPLPAGAGAGAGAAPILPAPDEALRRLFRDLQLEQKIDNLPFLNCDYTLNEPYPEGVSQEGRHLARLRHIRPQEMTHPIMRGIDKSGHQFLALLMVPTLPGLPSFVEVLSTNPEDPRMNERNGVPSIFDRGQRFDWEVLFNAVHRPEESCYILGNVSGRYPNPFALVGGTSEWAELPLNIANAFGGLDKLEQLEIGPKLRNLSRTYALGGVWHRGTTIGITVRKRPERALPYSPQRFFDDGMPFTILLKKKDDLWTLRSLNREEEVAPYLAPQKEGCPLTLVEILNNRHPIFELVPSQHLAGGAAASRG